MTAIKTILVADLVMSLDNVIAVAAAAGGSYVLLILGLAISIPLVVFGATLLIKLMERFPIIITAGAGLIGWVAGEMLVADLALQRWFEAMGVRYKGEHPQVAGVSLEIIAAIIGFIVVVALGKWLGSRKPHAAAEQPADGSARN
jgi:predicted tellurium resistance membrane protein TerC